MSARTGRAPAWRIAFTVAQNVIGVVIISSPNSRFNEAKDSWSAAVHEFRAIEVGEPTYSRKSLSNSAVLGPVPIQPDFKVKMVSWISSGPIYGAPNIM